jgi:uncharacterized protein with von Willebrand factor type A (vWA) domain
MNKDELLKLLDLNGKEAPPEQRSELSITPAVSPMTAVDASPTALELDEWALRRGRDLLAESERLQTPTLDEHAVADFHACAFLPEPKLAEHCVDRQRKEFVEQLLQTPDYHALHKSTMLHEVASAIATTAFSEQFAALKTEEMPESPHTLSGEMSTLRAVGRAVSAAREAVDEAADIAGALGMGPGSPGANDPRAVAALYRRVRDNPTLRGVCELAGRYRRVAQSRQRRKTTHGLDDVVGVVMDGDLGRLLPSELAKLMVPEFEDDMLRRLAERQAQCREYHASEPVGKGPIIVCLDESGSMEGDKVHTGKALALALAWVARRQRRWCALVAYSGDSGERLLALPPGRWDELALLAWLEPFIGCGSNLDVPVRELPDYYARLGASRGETDVLFITDAICRVDREAQNRFSEWKATVNARLISLVLNEAAGDLASVSDEVHLVRTLDVSEAAVERVLSL